MDVPALASNARKRVRHVQKLVCRRRKQKGRRSPLKRSRMVMGLDLLPAPCNVNAVGRQSAGGESVTGRDNSTYHIKLTLAKRVVATCQKAFVAHVRLAYMIQVAHVECISRSHGGGCRGCSNATTISISRRYRSREPCQ